MGDEVDHECGIGLVVARQPLDVLNTKYLGRYATSPLGELSFNLTLGLKHRGQQGAGLASAVLDPTMGSPYLFCNTQARNEDTGDKYVDKLFESPVVRTQLQQGVCHLSHTRYGTNQGNGDDFMQPRHVTSKYRQMAFCGALNGNLTNIDEILAKLQEHGNFAESMFDVDLMNRSMSHGVGEEFQRVMDLQGPQADHKPEFWEEYSKVTALREVTDHWKGAWIYATLFGDGDVLVARHAEGIRRFCWYEHDDFVVGASEDDAIISSVRAFTGEEIHPGDVRVLEPAQCLEISPLGAINVHNQIDEGDLQGYCTFESTYFEGGNSTGILEPLSEAQVDHPRTNFLTIDPVGGEQEGEEPNAIVPNHILRERLGLKIAPSVKSAIDDVDCIENARFAGVPKSGLDVTAGLIQGLKRLYIDDARKTIEDPDELADRLEELAFLIDADEAITKTFAERTFITDQSLADQRVMSSYESRPAHYRGRTICAGEDTLVKGRTTRLNLTPELANNGAKNIIWFSSAPAVAYPCYFGIDFAVLTNLLYFQGALRELITSNRYSVIEDIFEQAHRAVLNDDPDEHEINFASHIYREAGHDRICENIGRILRPDDFTGEVRVIYPTVDMYGQTFNNEDRCMTCHDGNTVVPRAYHLYNRGLLFNLAGDDRRGYEVHVDEKPPSKPDLDFLRHAAKLVA